jgi:hypothetical protein
VHIEFSEFLVSTCFEFCSISGRDWNGSSQWRRFVHGSMLVLSCDASSGCLIAGLYRQLAGDFAMDTSDILENLFRYCWERRQVQSNAWKPRASRGVSPCPGDVQRLQYHPDFSELSNSLVMQIEFVEFSISTCFEFGSISGREWKFSSVEALCTWISMVSRYCQHFAGTSLAWLALQSPVVWDDNSARVY